MGLKEALELTSHNTVLDLELRVPEFESLPEDVIVDALPTKGRFLTKKATYAWGTILRHGNWFDVEFDRSSNSFDVLYDYLSIYLESDGDILNHCHGYDDALHFMCTEGIVPGQRFLLRVHDPKLFDSYTYTWRSRVQAKFRNPCISPRVPLTTMISSTMKFDPAGWILVFDGGIRVSLDLQVHICPAERRRHLATVNR